MDYYSILSSLGVKENQIKRYEVISENGETLFWIEIIPNQRTCPICSNLSNIKEYKIKTIKALSSFGSKTYIELKLPRYVCLSCGKTYTHDLNISFKSLHKPIIKDMIEDLVENTDLTLTKADRGKFMKILKGKVDMKVANDVLGGMLQ